ncbi:MAG: hypothetical protein WC525_04970 [Candidatus Thermoplasmatota archaeon]
MVKDNFNKIKFNENLHELKTHSDHLKNHEIRLQTLEATIPSIKQELQNEFQHALSMEVKNATKDLSKDLRTRVQTQIMEKVNEEIGKVVEQFDSLRNTVFVDLEQKIASYKGLAKEILQNRKERNAFDISDSTYISMAMIVTGTVSQCQELQDDVEPGYGVRKIFAQTTQFPNKFEVDLKKIERGTI